MITAVTIVTLLFQFPGINYSHVKFQERRESGLFKSMSENSIRLKGFGIKLKFAIVIPIKMSPKRIIVISLICF